MLPPDDPIPYVPVAERDAAEQRLIATMTGYEYAHDLIAAAVDARRTRHMPCQRVNNLIGKVAGHPECERVVGMLAGIIADLTIALEESAGLTPGELLTRYKAGTGRILAALAESIPPAGEAS